MKNRSSYSQVLVAAVAAMVVTSTPWRAWADDSNETYTLTQTTKSMDGTAEQTEYLFKKTYVYMTYLKNDAVSARVKDGVMTLVGTVADEAHHRLAEDTAANLPQVIRVDNQLKTSAAVAAENADQRLGRKVRLVMQFHRTINAGKTIVEVKNGVVTLHGEAASKTRKKLAAEYAQNIEGVKKVKNLLTVAAMPEPAGQTVEPKLDDASVTAQVKLALLTHRSTSSIKTPVATRDGVVTLTGMAKNATEKSRVSKLVADIHGVAGGVHNEMTVEKGRANWFWQ